MDRVKRFDETMMIILGIFGLILCAMKFFIGFDNDGVAGMYGGVQLVEMFRYWYLYYNNLDKFND